jgi:hypothetical protein
LGCHSRNSTCSYCDYLVARSASFLNRKG